MAEKHKFTGLSTPEIERKPPKGWKPDRFEQIYGIVGRNHCIGDGRYDQIKGLPARETVGPIAKEASLKFLAEHPGQWFSSEQVTKAVGMACGGPLTTLRIEGRVRFEKRESKYYHTGK